MQHLKTYRLAAMLATASNENARCDSQAYQILHRGFVALPMLAALDKLSHL